MNSLKIVKQHLQNSHTVILTTHREPDGDGLGSQIALFYALKKIHKNVRILNLDPSPQKYEFLGFPGGIEIYEGETIPSIDCAVILDTNDKRLVSPLYEQLEKSARTLIFLDHHPLLTQGPQPTSHSYIDTKAASTGEITFQLIQELGIPLDKQIAQALYTSLVFDTQLFRFIRNSPNSHRIAAELLTYNIEPEKIHRALFGNFTKNKLLFTAKALNEIEFFEQDQFAFLRISEKDLKLLGLTKDHTKDIIDWMMNMDTIEAALVALEIAEDEYKLSFRSKGNVQVLKAAEAYGGGGHLYASGAYVKGNLKQIKHDSIQALSYNFKRSHGTKT